MTRFGVQPSLHSAFFPPARVHNAWLALDEQAILNLACTLHQVTMKGLLGPCRITDMVKARRYAAKQLLGLGMSTVQIGRVLNRHPSTIHNLLGRKKRKK